MGEYVSGAILLSSPFLLCLYITDNINNLTELNKLECLACAAIQHISKIAGKQQFYKQED